MKKIYSISLAPKTVKALDTYGKSLLPAGFSDGKGPSRSSLIEGILQEYLLKHPATKGVKNGRS